MAGFGQAVVAKSQPPLYRKPHLKKKILSPQQKGRCRAETIFFIIYHFKLYICTLRPVFQPLETIHLQGPGPDTRDLSM